MANKEHLKMLKRGVEFWNQWRKTNPKISPNLSGVRLIGPNLSGPSLTDPELKKADISPAELAYVDFSRTDLSDAVLVGANLECANLTEANLERANLLDVILYRATVDGTNLRGAKLIFAHLSEAHFEDADLADANLSGALVGWSTFSNIDLSAAKDLKLVEHEGPSTIGVDTIYRSKGKIPESFLRNAGVPDNFIAYVRSLNSFDYPSCFISLSYEDKRFAEVLHVALGGRGVRCYFPLKDLRIGDRFRPRIHELIQKYDKLLVILSQNSISSSWVEDEVEAAFERERKEKKLVLFPIMIDDAVMQCGKGWAATLKRTRTIGDFTGWKDSQLYDEAFDRLMRDLSAEMGK